MVNSNYFYPSPIGFESYFLGDKIDTQNTIKNFTIICSYIPVISIIIGISRIVFAAQILYSSNDENLRQLAILHIFRGTAELLCIGLVCIVADLHFCSINQKNIINNRDDSHKNPNQTLFENKYNDLNCLIEKEKKKSQMSKEHLKEEASSSFSGLDTSSSDTISSDLHDQKNPISILLKNEELIISQVNNVICKQDKILLSIKNFIQKDISKGYLQFQQYEEMLKEFSELDQIEINTNVLNIIESNISNIHLLLDIFINNCKLDKKLAKKITKYPQAGKAEIIKCLFLISTLKLFLEVKKDELANVMNTANKFINDIATTKIYHNSTLSAFIETMQPLPNTEREKVYDLTLDLFYLVLQTCELDFKVCKHDKGKIEFIIKIMQLLANVDPDDRLDILNISKENINYFRLHLAIFIEQMRKIKRSDRREILNQAFELCTFTERQHPNYLNQALNFLAEYESENRKRILDFIYKLVAIFGKIDIDTIKGTTEALLKILPILINYNYENDNSRFIMKFIESDNSACVTSYPLYSLGCYCTALNNRLKEVANEKENIFEYTMGLISLVHKSKIKFHTSAEMFEYINIISLIPKLRKEQFYKLSTALINVCEMNVNINEIHDVLKSLSEIPISEWQILINLFEKLHTMKKRLTQNEFNVLNEILNVKDEHIRVCIIFFQWSLEKTIEIDPKNLSLEEGFKSIWHANNYINQNKMENLLTQFRKEYGEKYHMEIIVILLQGLNDKDSFIYINLNKDIIYHFLQQLNIIFEGTYTNEELKSLLMPT